MMKILMLIFAFAIFSVFPTTEIIAGCGSIAPYPHVAKKNGVYESRSNDLWELAQDWYYYRWKIIEQTRKKDIDGANEARDKFQQINDWLEQYPEDHVQKVLDKAGTCSDYN